LVISRVGVAPKVSIVIVNWNTRDLLESCLESVFKETTSIPIEVIIVDNDSSDGSREMVKQRFQQVRLIENKANLGFARGTNQGFGLATGQYVLMLNSDTVILDGAIEKTVAFADCHPEAGGIGCRLQFPDSSFQNSCFRLPNLLGILLESLYLSQSFKRSFLFNWNRYGCRDRDWDSYREVDCVMGSFLLLRRAVLQEVGFLDPGYFVYGEETDLCYRISRAGWKIYYYPEASIVHVHQGSQKSWANAAWAFGATNRGILYFLYKWKRPAAYFSNLALALGMVPRLVVWAALDLKESIASLTFKKRHLFKGAGLRFHLKAIVRPSAMAEGWERK
jgi:GT2 family glycosyltransferase